jgi:hypothetical protein
MTPAGLLAAGYWQRSQLSGEGVGATRIGDVKVLRQCTTEVVRILDTPAPETARRQGPAYHRIPTQRPLQRSATIVSYFKQGLRSMVLGATDYQLSGPGQVPIYLGMYIPSTRAKRAHEAFFYFLALSIQKHLVQLSLTVLQRACDYCISSA